MITSITASPRSIPAGGGKVSVKITATNAATCIFSGTGLSFLTAPCGFGSASETITFNASTEPTAHIWTVYAIAKSPGGRSSRYAHTTITQAGTGLPASLSGYLQTCTPGPNCDYGPINASYPTYGNTAPNAIGDCTFAAAADWEQIVLGTTADPTAIGYEFAAAGGSATNGLTLPALWAYWEQQGINGVTMTGLHSYYTDQTDVENGVRDYGALLVWFDFGSSNYLGPIQANPGYHLAVVDGFTPEGPLVVTWGQTLQTTWQQWNATVVAVYGIGTS